jgi:hypothetical protein
MLAQQVDKRQFQVSLENRIHRITWICLFFEQKYHQPALTDGSLYFSLSTIRRQKSMSVCLATIITTS